MSGMLGSYLPMNFSQVRLTDHLRPLQASQGYLIDHWSSVVKAAAETSSACSPVLYEIIDKSSGLCFL